MVDSSPSFMPLLMTWVFKEESFCTLNTNFFFSMNIFSLSPFLHHLLLLRHSHPSTLIKPSYYGAVKSQGSSRYKGKAVVFDPPAIPDVSEEAKYSKSEHSIEEETQRDPDSECTPLIDPWYDVHLHFPKIPGDHALPPAGHVWLSLCR